MAIACVDTGFYVSYYPITIFFEDLGTLMLFVLPGAICVVLWKVFITNRTTPRGNVLALGLDESSATAVELYGRKIPWKALALHALVGAGTFKLGVLAFEAYRYLQEFLASLGVLS